MRVPYLPLYLISSQLPYPYLGVLEAGESTKVGQTSITAFVNLFSKPLAIVSDHQSSSAYSCLFVDRGFALMTYTGNPARST